LSVLDFEPPLLPVVPPLFLDESLFVKPFGFSEIVYICGRVLSPFLFILKPHVVTTSLIIVFSVGSV